MKNLFLIIAFLMLLAIFAEQPIILFLIILFFIWKKNKPKHSSRKDGFEQNSKEIFNENFDEEFEVEVEEDFEAYNEDEVKPMPNVYVENEAVEFNKTNELLNSAKFISNIKKSKPIEVDRLAHSEKKSSEINKKELISDDKELLQKFEKMRNNLIYATLDEGRRFVEQAKYMADFVDNYGGVEEYISFHPTYSYMSNNQLRTYFTWRSKERNGNYTKISKSYVLIYIYEILNNIGVTSNEDAIKKLVRILKEYANSDIAFGKEIAEWIKEYYICNEFDISFKEVVTKYKIEEYYPDMFFEITKENAFDICNTISNYDIKKSNFYTDDNAVLVKECFGKVYEELKDIFEAEGLNVDYLFVGSPNKSNWFPYSKAIYDKNQMFGNKEQKQVSFSNYESYIFANDSWVCIKHKLSNNEANILGYILKCLESKLCEATNYKNKFYSKITTGSATNLISSFSEYYIKLRNLLNRSVIETCIDKVVKEHLN